LFFEIDCRKNPGKTAFSFLRAYELQSYYGVTTTIELQPKWGERVRTHFQKHRENQSVKKRFAQIADSRLQSNRALFAFWALIALISFSSVSCTNSLSARGLASSSTGSGSGTGTTNLTGTTLVTITNVLKDNINPSTTLDIFGDGSSSMAQYCTSSGGLAGGSSTGASTTAGTSNCACNYTFVTSGGVTETVQADTTYHESNMIECLYTGIPAGIATVTVSIDLISQAQTSNSITYALSSSSSGTSTTNISSFTQVSRYQCKDVVSIPYVFGPSINPLQANAIYDPVMSESPSLSYPLDFYTTNLGGTYAQYVAANLPSSGEYWDCPANPTATSANVNMNLYSVAADGGSYQIYPYSGSGHNRSTFYVSNTSNGVFTVPLNTYVAPTMIAENVNTNGAPTGYGASPISTGTGTESCPDTVAIPTGYQWVKVWLFRADLADRHYQVSTAVETASAVACSPGAWPTGQTSAGMQIFEDCGSTTVATTPGECKGACPEANIGTQTLTAGQLADRVITGEGNTNGAVCVDMNYGRGPAFTGPATCIQTGGLDTCQGPGATSLTSTSQFPGGTYAPFGLGTDYWLMRQYVFSCSGTNDNAGASQQFADPLDLCGKKYGIDNVPSDRALTSVDLDTGNPRYDFVYVVTPESVESGLMESDDPSIYPYIPVRWPNASDCSSPDPNNPETVGDCPQSKMIQYGIQLQDIGTSGAPTGTAGQPVIYPMCALQPITGS
jgi:hypothetical protein